MATNLDLNQHISTEERDSWDTMITDLEKHKKNNEGGIHVPTPNGNGKYYLGSDLQWHVVPSITIN